MNFKVSTLHDDPPASGREGDVRDPDEEVVDAYLALRQLNATFSRGAPTEDYSSDVNQY